MIVVEALKKIGFCIHYVGEKIQIAQRAGGIVPHSVHLDDWKIVQHIKEGEQEITGMLICCLAATDHGVGIAQWFNLEVAIHNITLKQGEHMNAYADPTLTFIFDPTLQNEDCSLEGVPGM